MKPKIPFTVTVLLTVIALFSSILPAGCRASSQDETERTFRSALEKNPADLEARMGLARVLMEKDARSKAVAVLRQGMKDDPGNAPLLGALSEVYFAWGRGARDPRIFEVAERPLKKRVDASTARAETFKILGYVQKRLGRYENSIDSLAMAFELDPGDAFNKARLGYQYALTGRYEKGLPLLSEAIEQGEDHFLLWWWLGDTQRLLGDYENSRDSFNKAQRVASWRRAEINDEVAFSKSLLLTTKGESAVGAHRSMGDRHRKLGRYDRAVIEYKKALDFTPPDQYQWIGWLNRRLSICYRKVSKPDPAIDYAKRAIEAYTKRGDHLNLAYVYETLAQAYHENAHIEIGREEEFLEKAIDAREMQVRYATETGETKIANSGLRYLCSTAAELHGVEDARVQEYREQIIQRIPKTGPLKDRETASLVRFEAFLQYGEENYARAKELCKMVEPFYAQLDDPGAAATLASLYYSLACASEELGDLDDATMYAEKAVAKLAAMRSVLGLDEFRRHLGGTDWRWTHSILVSMALDRGEMAKAFNYMEQYKAHALLDLLGTKGIEGKRGMLRRKQDGKRRFLARVQSIEQQVEQAGTGGDLGNRGSLERNLSIEKTQYERLAEDVSVANLEIRSFENVESLKVEQLQPMADEFTIVSYGVSEVGICAGILSKEGVHGVGTGDLSEEKLRPLVDAFRREIGVKSDVSRDLTLEVEEKEEAPEKPEESASEQLYKLLIEPVLPYIKTKLVYISPDGVLNYLPFEALQKDGRYLIEDYSIAYAPSASVLKICMDRERNRRESVLALGNPNLKNPAFRLVHAENEVKALEGLFPQVDVYTGDDATESVVSQQGHEYDILHFACHGELNLDEPMLTSLRLAPDAENDGYLHAGEVFEHDLSASLVVLSACNSALGELTSGNELMGLTRSFLYAGVPSIVASLWTVDDRSTSYLMQHFYKNLATMNKADALREAKLETMKKYPSPFHWAAFCLQGDYR